MTLHDEATGHHRSDEWRDVERSMLRARGRQQREIALLDDDLLLRAAQEGDDGAFAVLYDRHYPKIFRFCRGRLRNVADAEDAVQETFLRARRALDRGADVRYVQAWLRAIAANLCIDQVQRRFRAAIDEVPDRTDEPSGADGPEAAVVALEEAETLSRALGRISSRHRSVLELREQEGWSYEEIAVANELELSAVKALIWRAREALRREYLQLTTEDTRLRGFALLPACLVRRGVGEVRRFVSAATRKIAIVPSSVQALNVASSPLAVARMAMSVPALVVSIGAGAAVVGLAAWSPSSHPRRSVRVIVAAKDAASVRLARVNATVASDGPLFWPPPTATAGVGTNPAEGVGSVSLGGGPVDVAPLDLAVSNGELAGHPPVSAVVGGVGVLSITSASSTLGSSSGPTAVMGSGSGTASTASTGTTGTPGTTGSAGSTGSSSAPSRGGGSRSSAPTTVALPGQGSQKKDRGVGPRKPSTSLSGHAGPDTAQYDLTTTTTEASPAAASTPGSTPSRAAAPEPSRPLPPVASVPAVSTTTTTASTTTTTVSTTTTTVSTTTTTVSTTTPAPIGLGPTGAPGASAVALAGDVGASSGHGNSGASHGESNGSSNHGGHGRG